MSKPSGIISVINWNDELSVERVQCYTNDCWSNVENRIMRATGIKGRLTINGIHHMAARRIDSIQMFRHGNRFVYLPSPEYRV
jgi:hypothetical protein